MWAESGAGAWKCGLCVYLLSHQTALHSEKCPALPFARSAGQRGSGLEDGSRERRGGRRTGWFASEYLQHLRAEKVWKVPGFRGISGRGWASSELHVTFNGRVAVFLLACIIHAPLITPGAPFSWPMQATGTSRLKATSCPPKTRQVTEIM